MALQLSTLFSGGQDSGMAGSGKRAYYAMISKNTSSTWRGAAWFDRNVVGSIFNTYAPDQYNTYAQSHITDNSDSTYQYGDAIWESIGASQTISSTNSGPNNVNGVHHCGEFGNSSVDAYSDGTLSHVYNRYSGDIAVKHYLNACAINSDHSNKRIVYILYNGVIRAVDRLYGSYHVAMQNTGDFSVPSLNANMTGSASYHAGRKELTIVSYQSSGGSYNCYTYSNVDFDKYPDPYVALNRPEVTRVDASLSLATSWQNNSGDAYYNLKPITTNNGNVYVSVFWESAALGLYRFTRSGASAITATYLQAQSTTTAYGKDQGINYGQRQITSRDGTSVATFCPYYYYGSGIKCYMIDKTNNTYTAYASNQSSPGIQIMPYGDSGWTFHYAGNGYSSNPSGNYLFATFARISVGGFGQCSGNQNYPYHTGPNTTNYPGMNQVVDYVLLQDNAYGPK